jgi:hypothetical protein
VDDAAALDTAVDMLDAHAPTGDAPIRSLLRVCELPSSWLSGRHDDLNLAERERQEAKILEQLAPCWQRVWGGIGNALIVGTARIGLTQKEHCEQRIDQQDVFDRVAPFLAAITARLLSRILGALNAPFGPIVAKRGEADAGAGAGVDRSAAGSDPGSGSTMAAASASATPRRWVNSVKDRVGASPSVRSVTRSTTKRT